MNAITAEALESQVHPAKSPNRFLRYTEPTRGFFDLTSFYAMRPLLSNLPKGDGHGVLVLPGFMASDTSTWPMRNLLRELGYDAIGWDLGRNIRVDRAKIEAMKGCVDALFERTGRKISVVGWSLGGVFARELAKMVPDKVRMVISLGSPISGDRDKTNARRLFKLMYGNKSRAERHNSFTDLAKAPPVPTTSILSKGDGVVHWRGSVQEQGEQTENIEVFASHIGLGVNPSVMIAIADRLAQDEEEWEPFRSPFYAKMMFPNTQVE